MAGSMIDLRRALQLAEQSLREIETAEHCGPLALLPAETVEVEVGWLIFWNSAEFANTRDPRDALVGPGPFLIHKALGTVQELASAPADWPKRR